MIEHVLMKLFWSVTFTSNLPYPIHDYIHVRLAFALDTLANCRHQANIPFSSNILTNKVDYLSLHLYIY